MKGNGRNAGWALLLAGFLPLAAAQMRPLAPEELASRADAVVLAKVAALETAREGRDGLVTRVELDVRATWKGPATNRLVLVQPGGTLGTRRVVVSGDARYALGEEVVVFAARNRSGEWLTLELGQGKFQVTRPEGGTPWVRGLFHGGDPAGPGARPPNLRPITLDALEARVKGAAR